jgi:cell shape-determining protein MreC
MWTCRFCGKSFEKQISLTGHLASHKKELRKEREEAKRIAEERETKEENNSIRSLCSKCRFYKNFTCVTAKQIPTNWLEELNAGECSLFEEKN